MCPQTGGVLKSFSGAILNNIIVICFKILVYILVAKSSTLSSEKPPQTLTDII